MPRLVRILLSAVIAAAIVLVIASQFYSEKQAPQSEVPPVQSPGPAAATGQAPKIAAQPREEAESATRPAEDMMRRREEASGAHMADQQAPAPTGGAAPAPVEAPSPSAAPGGAGSTRNSAAPAPNIIIPAPPADVSLPEFPWPPPSPSATYVFPADAFDAYPTIGEVASHIVDALETSGYVERSFFETKPGGVALVTRLERMADDGAPASPGRWPPGFASTPSDFAAFLRGLFYAEQGHYRILVFILQNKPFAPSLSGVSGEEAKAWLREGANTLPPEYASRSFDGGTCTALIYEFASDGTSVKVVESALTGKQHLEKAGVLAALH